MQQQVHREERYALSLQRAAVVLAATAAAPAALCLIGALQTHRRKALHENCFIEAHSAYGGCCVEAAVTENADLLLLLLLLRKLQQLLLPIETAPNLLPRKANAELFPQTDRW